MTGILPRSPATANRRPSALRVALAVALLGTVVGGVIAAANVASWDLDVVDRGVPYVALYDHPETKLQASLNQGDGQAFAALAQDPLLRRPEVFRAGPAEAVYRAQRPLLGWLTWIGSGGQAELVPLVLFLLSVVGFGALAGTLAWMLQEQGGSPLWALVVLLSPGALVTLDWAGPEAMGTAAALAGFLLWRGERRWMGVTLLLAAALLRESLLLVPVAMGVHAIVIDRRSWRSVVPLMAPLLAYIAWLVVLWLRLGHVPSDAGQGRLGAPFAGLGKALGGWTAGDGAVALLILAVGVVALVVARRDGAAWVAGAFVLVSLLFGAEVWRRAEDFGRVLLPALAFGIPVVSGMLGRSARPARSGG